MNPQSEHPHEVHRVVLPSGRTIEVIYFAEPGSEATSAAPAANERRELHICPDCASELVHPIAWEEVGPHWRIDLRCPNCAGLHSGTWDQETVEAFDEALDRGTQTLARDLRHLARANMEDAIERFSRALRVDAVLPEDF
ncbi:MAG: hypothetical protein ACR2ML_02210 [Solirubrobacteraceae bacterium]